MSETAIIAAKSAIVPCGAADGFVTAIGGPLAAVICQPLCVPY